MSNAWDTDLSKEKKMHRIFFFCFLKIMGHIDLLPIDVASGVHLFYDVVLFNLFFILGKRKKERKKCPLLSRPICKPWHSILLNCNLHTENSYWWINLLVLRWTDIHKKEQLSKKCVIQKCIIAVDFFFLGKLRFCVFGRMVPKTFNTAKLWFIWSLLHISCELTA